jgi:hypothetical protein
MLISCATACSLIVLSVLLPAPGTADAAPAGGGAELWVARYRPGLGSEDGMSVAASGDGSKVFVTGASQGTETGYDYGTTAYDASTGVLVWASRYNGPGNDDDIAWSVTTSPDGSKAFVTGSSYGADARRDAATIAYDAATGSVQWARRYSGPGPNSWAATQVVAPGPDGSRVFVAGYSFGAGTGQDYATIAYDAATGAALWTKRYNGAGNGNDYVESVAASPDGSTVFVTGSSWGVDNGYDFATVAYDAATGSALWEARYDGPDNNSDYASAGAVSPDGSRFLVTGSTFASGTGVDYATIAYDAATGSPLWIRRYDGPGETGYNDDVPRSLALSRDGSKVLVTGYSKGADGSLDYATIAYDATTGAALWGGRYGPGDGYAEPYSVAASPDGSKVFVTGFGRTAAAHHSDYVTVAHDAGTGSLLWVARYRGPGTTDQAFSVAASPDGSKVFVTGTSYGGGSPSDYATVAYDAGP